MWPTCGACGPFRRRRSSPRPGGSLCPGARRAVVRCGEADLAMKSTGQDGQQLLTSLLLELSAPRPEARPARR